MFYATDKARARHLYRLVNNKRMQWQRKVAELVQAAFETELVGLRKAIRGASSHHVKDLATAYLSSDANAQIWREVWKQINLNAGGDIWDFLKESEKIKSLFAEPEETKSALSSVVSSISGLGHYSTEWQNLVFEKVVDEGGRLVTQVTGTTQQQVGGVLAQAIADGRSTYQMEKILGQLYLDEIIPNRKEVIARTETARATNSATLDRAKVTNPYSMKRWISAGDDGRTRPEHLAMDDKDPIPLDEDFDCEDGTTEPGEAVNCRCVVGIVPPEEYTPEMFEEREEE